MLKSRYKSESTLPTTAPSTSNFSMEKLKENLSDIFYPFLKKQELKRVRYYAKYNQEIKSILYKYDELIKQGFSLSRYDLISNSNKHQFVASHQLVLASDQGQGITANNYSAMFHFQKSNYMFLSKLSSEGVIFGMYEQYFKNKDAHIQFQFNNHSNILEFEGYYTGKDWALDCDLSREGEVRLGYSQRLAEKLCGGISTLYNPRDRSTDISGRIRYSPNKITTIITELKQKGINDGLIFSVGYIKNIRHSLDFAVEIRHDFEKRKTDYKYGLEQEFLNGSFKCVVDQNFNFKGIYEHHLKPFTISIGAQVDAKSSLNPMLLMGGMTQGAELDSILFKPDVRFGLQITFENPITEEELKSMQ